MTQEAAPEKKTNPIVPFLRIPEKYPDEPAYFWGVKCQQCGAKFLGSRTACGNCGSTGPFEEQRFSDEGEIYVFSVVHQTVPGLEAPYVAAIIDLKDGVAVRANVYGLDPQKPSTDWFGKKVKMYTEKIRVDREGNDIVAAKFRVVN
ncbi:MAG TPA: OB-fold domain-containing protein [Dehalococcoidia bacterium]|nr:OB-fold domain-containing protein [Dehalococcoidia bacterium]